MVLRSLRRHLPTTRVLDLRSEGVDARAWACAVTRANRRLPASRLLAAR